METRDDTQNWFHYGEPPPAFGGGSKSKSTCFVLLLLFLIAPNLTRIPAFNHAGCNWDGSPNPRWGDIVVGFNAERLLLEFVGLNQERQDYLEILFMMQTVFDMQDI
jgi:hypothetical protein